MWYVAGLGIVLGNEDYALGIVSTLFVLSVLTYFERATNLIRPTAYRRLEVNALVDSSDPLIEQVKALLKARHIRILDIEGQANEDDEKRFVFFVSTRDREQGPGIAEEVCALEGVTSASWRGIR